MSIDKYDPIRVLGEGSFGKVYLMRDKVRRNFVCVKVIKIKNIPKKEREATKMEVDLLRRLHHPNIVRYIDSFLSRNNESLCICMEYCDGGDLASQVKAARRNLFSEAKILHWFVQLALGLHYMHSNKVLHRDLKTQNVFLLGNGRLVLGDLGISKVLDGTMDFAQTCIGTPYYMSPEIFQNKPYSYKSDVWALGCVLYEMTTLNHAFDANSLNGLAGKIVKGKYPPIHHKYSRYLRELIAQMLQINPQQRPDLDQILRKPFIRKHVVHFFTDIASRPSTSIGEGTMIMRAAVVVGGATPVALSSDANVVALQRQLQGLDMADAVSEALNPKNIESVRDDPVEAKKLVKEQASALRREKEHKQMVEAALEKLRQERELRSKNRGAVGGVGAAAQPQGVAAGYAGGGLRKEDPQRPAASRQPQPTGISRAGVAQGQQPPPYSERDRDRERIEAARKDLRERDGRDGAVAGGGLWGPAANVGRKVEGAYAAIGGAPAAGANIRKPSFLVDERKREQEREDRRREEVRAEARVREEARLREEAKQREEAAAKQKMDQMRAQAEAAARREQQREKERMRQREEIEQLKRDKLELDRRAAERDRLREERREEELRKLEEERRKQQDVVADLSPRFESARGDASRARAIAEEKEAMSARDRVLQRKQDKLAKDENDRIQALRAAEMENRRLRALANNQQYAQYHPSAAASADALGAGMNMPVRTGAGLGGGAPLSGLQEQDERTRLQREQSGRSVDGAALNADQLAQKLQEATKGKNRFGGGGGGRSSPEQSSSRHSGSSAAAAVRRGGRSDVEDYSSGSPSDDDTSIWEKGSDHPDDEEEDLRKREEELKAELDIATMRCEELKRTLQATKSFVDPHGIPSTRRNSAVLGGGAVQKPSVSTVVSEETEDEEEDDEDYEYADDFDQERDNSAASDAAAAAPKGRPPRPQNVRLGDRSPAKASRDKDDYPSQADNTTPRINRAPPAAVKASPYYGLQDAPSPSGRLSDRIVRLRQRCIEALGRDSFNEAYQFLRDHEDRHAVDGRIYEEDMEEEKISRMRAILGEGRAHYMPLIEQLIFMEETHSG